MPKADDAISTTAPPDAEEERITPERLRALFEQHRIIRGIGGSHKLPSGEGFARLATVLDSALSARQSDAIFRPRAENAWRLSRALWAVAQALPPVLNIERWKQEVFEKQRRDKLATVQRQLVLRLEIIADAVEAARSAPQIWDRGPPWDTSDNDDWHCFAPYLADAFREAMRTTNPGVEFALSNTGPLARFLVAVIPLLTGDAPTANAVARHLQRTAGNTPAGAGDR